MAAAGRPVRRACARAGAEPGFAGVRDETAADAGGVGEGTELDVPRRRCGGAAQPDPGAFGPASRRDRTDVGAVESPRRIGGCGACRASARGPRRRCASEPMAMPTRGASATTTSASTSRTPSWRGARRRRLPGDPGALSRPPVPGPDAARPGPLRPAASGSADDAADTYPVRHPRPLLTPVILGSPRSPPRKLTCLLNAARAPAVPRLRMAAHSVGSPRPALRCRRSPTVRAPSVVF